MPDPTYLPFLLKGFVSLTGKKEDQVEVQMLRDTGVAQWFVCADVLSFSEESSVGSSRLVQSFSMEVIRVPIHRIHLQSDLVTDIVEVGVRPVLSVKGVSFILGNHLAGGQVIPLLEVVDTPLTHLKTGELYQKYPSAFPACVVTRAQSKKGNDISLSDSFLCTDETTEEFVIKSNQNLVTSSYSCVLLLIMCTTTRYRKAIPLRKITAKVVVKALTKFFSTFNFRLPKVMQTDQGTNFVSKLCSQVFQSLNITHRISSAYHPQSQGMLERFHQTLKSMLKKYCIETGNEWDEGVPLLLFSIRETVQESLKFSLSELVFGYTVRGPLKALKERMLGIERLCK